MEFYIRQGASDPILKLELIDDGKNDKSSFHSQLENAIITIDVFDVKTGEYLIIGESCNVAQRTKKYNYTTDEYYIIYRFTEEQTSVKGKFEAIVTIQFVDESFNPTTKLIVPIKEKLYINII